MNLDATSLLPIIISASFAAGLNTYATILVLGFIGRMNWAAIPGGLTCLENPWVLGAAAVLFAGEFVADKIPGFDLVWNVAHTFIRVPIAALMAFSAASHLSPEQQALVTLVGAVFASIAHGTKLAARVIVTPSPEPFSNIGLSVAEDGAAIAIAGCAVFHSLLVAGLIALSVAIFIIILLRRVVRLFRGTLEARWGAQVLREEKGQEQKKVQLRTNPKPHQVS